MFIVLAKNKQTNEQTDKQTNEQTNKRTKERTKTVFGWRPATIGFVPTPSYFPWAKVFSFQRAAKRLYSQPSRNEWKL